jgi:HSP20 family protein
MFSHHLKRLNDRFFDGQVDLTPFNQVIASFNNEVDSYARRIDITEGEDAHTARLMLPGVKLAGVDIEIEQGVLTVQAKSDKYRFKRSIYLGDNIDETKITAKLEDGILTIHLPLLEKVKPRKVKVT